MALTSQLGTSDSLLENIILEGGLSGSVYDVSLTIAGTASTAASSLLSSVNVLTISATDSVTMAGSLILGSAITASAAASATGSSGQDYYPTAAVSGVSGVSLLPGTGWSRTISIDGIASTSEALIAAPSEVLSIDGTSSADATSVARWNPLQVIAGIAAANREYIGDQHASLSLAVVAAVYTDGYYNSVMLTALESFDVAASAHPYSDSEHPAGASSVAVQATAVFRRTVSQTLGMSQNARTRPLLQAAMQSFVMSQTAANGNVHNRSIVQTLPLSQESYRLYPAIQTLVINSQATCTYVHVRRVTQSLSMSQQASKRSVVIRGATNTLSINQGKILPLPFIAPRCQYFTAIPGAYVAVLRNKCDMTIGVAERTVVLPCPQLGDTQGYSGTINLKRSMTGETLTYVRRSRQNKLRYTFWLGRKKTIELEDFVFNFSDRLITVYNWKGETWLAYITNNPIDFTAKERYQPTGERFEVSLEFEGVKIGG